MTITKEITRAMEKAKIKIKNEERNAIAKEFQSNSGWLCAINDIIDRTILAVRDELEVDVLINLDAKIVRPRCAITCSKYKYLERENQGKVQVR
ncbi:hypothetical protein LCGC14_2329840, partial [marine sediment metagenome]